MFMESKAKVALGAGIGGGLAVNKLRNRKRESK